VNEAKVDFTMTDDEQNNQFILDIMAFKHMDTSLMDADVHPTYVRVILKGKTFQLCLDEEVKPDTSKAQRSTTTGNLVITMPKAKSVIIQPNSSTKNRIGSDSDKNQQCCLSNRSKRETLEVDPTKHTMPDIGNIVKEKVIVPPLGSVSKRVVKERENSAGFIDDPDVPPLE